MTIWAFREFGTLPSALEKETPHTLWRLIFGNKTKPTIPIPLDSLEGLKRMNRKREELNQKPVTGRTFKSVLQSVPDAKVSKRGG